MPITKSAKKELRSSRRKRGYNENRRRAMRDVVKKIKKLAVSGDKKESEKMLSQAYKAIDKAAKRGVIKKNTAARKKSRLTRFLQKA